MKQKLVAKYISIIFIIATFMGTLHYHNDIQEHNDCQICTIQNDLTNVDTPSDVEYVQSDLIQNKAILTSLKNFQQQKNTFTFSARAPPLFS